MTDFCTEQVAIYRCLLDIAVGMDYLHSLGVLHGKQQKYKRTQHLCLHTATAPVCLSDTNP